MFLSVAPGCSLLLAVEHTPDCVSAVSSVPWRPFPLALVLCLPDLLISLCKAVLSPSEASQQHGSDL